MTKITRNGRAQLTEIADAERLTEFLDDVGYPELLEDMLQHIHAAPAH